MYDFMYKNKGAVSIFLVIVLVPMLVISSIFVDMSRIRLAESVAESTGELTLNTALTNYDAVLKDMYGLFATSQDTDELFDNLENYYRQCIEAAGVAEADADDYVAQIMQFLKGATGKDDMLNMNLTSFEVSKPTGGSLANPAVLKSQIVEFMKYRGPINLGTGIFDALSSLKNVKKQSELVDNKNKFYDKRTDIMETLESIWNKLEDYQYRDAYPIYTGDKSLFPQGTYLADYANGMNNQVDPLKKAIAYTVRYLYFAQDYGSFTTNSIKDFRVSKDNNPDDSTYAAIWTVNQTDKYEYKILATPEEVSVSALEGDLKTAFNAIQTLEKNNEVANQLSQGNANLSDTEKISIVSTTQKTLGTSYHNNVKNLIAALVELQNSFNGCKDDITTYYVIISENASGTKTLSFTQDNEQAGVIPMQSFITSQLSHLKEEDEYVKIYNNLMTRVSGYWDDTHDIVREARSYVNTYTNSAYTYASMFDSFLNEKIKLLNDASTALSSVKGQLSNSESDYNKALAAWKKSANNLSDDSLGQSDKKEIEQLEKVLTIEKVEKLITRVNAAKQSLQTLKTNVDSYKVLGKAWKDLNGGGSISYNTLYNLLSTSQKDSIGAVSKSTQIATETIGTSGTTAKYDKAYDSIVNQLTATIETKTLKTDWAASEAAQSPDMTKNQVELYTWLYNNFFNEANAKAKYSKRGVNDYSSVSSSNKTSDITDNKNNADKTQDEMEKKAEKYNNESTKSGTAPNRGYDASYLPSGEWSGVLDAIKSSGDPSSDADSMLSNSSNGLSILDDVLGLIGNMATTFRDNLYVVNYIMNMFSYSTYEAEISVKNGVDIGAFESWYEWNATDNKYQLTGKFNGYTKSSQMLKDARTLSKVSINPNANYLYGKEVEYIIYGDNGVGKAYGTIYLLRFALNTVYAFTDAEIGNLTTAAATALFGTPPLTPLIPVAKIAMTIGLALAESAYDLYQLKCGEAVPLIKNNNTWIMKPSSAAKAVVGEIVEQVVDEAIDKGVQVLNEALEMTDKELEKLINEGGEALQNLAHAATESTISELKNYGNQAVQQIVSICNNVNTVAMMEEANYLKGKTPEKINAAIQQLDAWLATQGSSESDVVYLAKKTAVDYLKQNSGKAIGELFDAIENVSGLENNTDLAELINRKLTDIQTAVDEKIDDLTEKAGNALNDLKNSAMQKLKDAASQGAEKLRSSLKEQIGAAFGTSSSKTTGTNNIVSSLLSWHYSDYLQLFLLIGIVASPESILLRTADVIELNMQQIDGNLGYVDVTTETEVSRLWGLIKYTKTETTRQANAEAFKLSQSYTYLNIKATIEVRPILLTLPLMAKTVESQITGTNWYQITYEGTLGY